MIASRFELLVKLRTHMGLFIAGLLCAQAMPAGAVLFYTTSDPNYNTAPPAKAFTNSGWECTGQWGQYVGTAIASKYFITAAHVGGSVGDPFVFHGVTNLTTAVYQDPETDLIIWRVDGELAPVAPLYTKRHERGKGEIVIGRGTLRGAEVRVNGVLSGWEWDGYDGLQRWGRSVVAGITPDDYLWMVFRARSKSSGVDLSGGDSGGPVFIKDGKSWKLAGVNYAVDGPFNTTTSGDGFEAAIFDARGLYVAEGTNWTLIPEVHAKVPTGFYATRISSRTNWINSVIQQP